MSDAPSSTAGDSSTSWWESIATWSTDHPGLLTALGAGSVVMFVGSLIAIPWLVARIPSDHFVRRRTAPADHSVSAWVRVVVQNIFGVVLILAGVAMLILPGQGILAILLGLGLTTFPGKRKLEVALLRRPAVFRAISWLRRRRGRDPLELPPR